MEVSMRHLKDINMKKATLLLVMTCCTIGLGRVGTSDGGELNNEVPPPVEALKETGGPANIGDGASNVNKAGNTQQAISVLLTEMKLDETQVGQLRNILLRIMGGCVIPETEYKRMRDNLDSKLKESLNSALTNYGDSVLKDYRRLLAMMLAMRNSKLLAFTEKAAIDVTSGADRGVFIGEKNENSSYQLITVDKLRTNVIRYTKCLVDIVGSGHYDLYVPGLLEWQGLRGKEKLYSDIKNEDLGRILLGTMSKIIQTYLVLKAVVLHEIFNMTGSSVENQGKYMRGVDKFKDTVNNALTTKETNLTLLGSQLVTIPNEITKFINSAIEQAVLNPENIIPLNLEKTLNEIHVSIMQKSTSRFSSLFTLPASTAPKSILRR